jgi:hypothetical protein
VPSVQPVTVTDLNGVEFNAGEMIIEDVVGYVGYVRSLCTNLGTEMDTPEGRKDFLDFQNEINSSVIETFEPDAMEQSHHFASIDLTGQNDIISSYPMMTYFPIYNGQVFNSYSRPVTPFDLPQNGDYIPDNYVTPFDFDDAPRVKNNQSFNDMDLT